jgi:hypothetical protein
MKTLIIPGVKRSFIHYKIIQPNLVKIELLKKIISLKDKYSISLEDINDLGIFECTLFEQLDGEDSDYSFVVNIEYESNSCEQEYNDIAYSLNKETDPIAHWFTPGDDIKRVKKVLLPFIDNQ